MTKQEMFNKLEITNHTEKNILSRCSSARELKLELEHLANQVNCLKSQLHNPVQYYLGHNYYTDERTCDRVLNAVHSLAAALKYEINYSQGFYFVR